MSLRPTYRRSEKGVLEPVRLPVKPVFIPRQVSHGLSKADLAKEALAEAGPYTDPDNTVMVSYGQLPGRTIGSSRDSDGPEFVSHHPPQTVAQLRSEEAKKGTAPLTRPPTVEERRISQSRQHRRRRSAEMLELMESIPGDVPVRKSQDASTPKGLHDSTVLYGKPSEMNNTPKLGNGRQVNKYERYLNVQAPLHCKSAHLMDHAAKSPGHRTSDRVMTASSAGPPSGIRLTATSSYGHRVDLRKSDVQYHMMQKEKRAATAQRQLDLLRTEGLPTYNASMEYLPAFGASKSMTAGSMSSLPSLSASSGSLADAGRCLLQSRGNIYGRSQERVRTAPLQASASASAIPVSPLGSPSSHGERISAMPSAEAFPFAHATSGAHRPVSRPPSRPPPAALAQSLTQFSAASASAVKLPASTKRLVTSDLDGVDLSEATADALLRSGSTLALAHLNKTVRQEDGEGKTHYLDYALHQLVARPTQVNFGMLRLSVEYCFPISIHNTSLVLRRFRVAAAYLTPKSVPGRLRCRYPSLKLAPGIRSDLFVIVRGDAVGKLEGFVEVASDDGLMRVPVRANILSVVEFANAVARNAKPSSKLAEPSDDDVDPEFAEYIVPQGNTHRSVVPVLPKAD